jgi:hypothetical protein
MSPRENAKINRKSKPGPYPDFLHGAPEARHYIHPRVPRLWRSNDMIDVPALLRISCTLR